MADLYVLLVINFGLDVESCHPHGWCMDNCRRRTVLTKDENVVYPDFSPDENVNCDQEREKYWHKDGSINDEEPVPNGDVVSGRLLET